MGIASPGHVTDVLETDVPTVRIVKPFQHLEMMIKEIKETEEGRAIAVGTDIDFFYGGKRGDTTFVPKGMALKSVKGCRSLSEIDEGVLVKRDFLV